MYLLKSGHGKPIAWHYHCTQTSRYRRKKSRARTSDIVCSPRLGAEQVRFHICCTEHANANGAPGTTSEHPQVQEGDDPFLPAARWWSEEAGMASQPGMEINRYLCGPALLRNSLGQRRRPLCQVDMVVSCGWRAQAASASGEGHLTRSSSRDGKFRKQGESMTSFCIRHREEYNKVCRALTCMMRSQKSELWKEQGSEIVLQAEHLERVLQ